MEPERKKLDAWIKTVLPKKASENGIDYFWAECPIPGCGKIIEATLNQPNENRESAVKSEMSTHLLMDHKDRLLSDDDRS